MPASGAAANQRWISEACAATRKNTGPTVSASSAGTHSTSHPGAGRAISASEIGSTSAASSSSAR